MELEDRIEQLSRLLSRHSVEEINWKYKEIELRYVNYQFSKFPNVQYSDEMKKRMISEAKRKKLSNSKMDYLQSLIDMNHSFNELEYKEEFETQINQFVAKLKELKLDESTVGLILLEHDYEPTRIYCHIYRRATVDRYNQELTRFDTTIDFSSIWGFLNKNRFESLSDLLEEVDVEEEEYPQIISELFKLRSYRLIKNAIQEDRIKYRIKSEIGLENIVIEIGEHDNRKFEIYKE